MTPKHHTEKLITAPEIAHRIEEMAEQINRDYQGKEILLLGTLKGAYVFIADLSRKITVPTEIDFLKVSSYGDSTSPVTQVTFDHRPLSGLTGKHILLVEDIVDTGHTLAFLRKYLEDQNPESLRVCALLDKSERRQAELPDCEYIGFSIPDKFVVGYGLDYAQRYRNLPDIEVVIFED